MPEPPPRRRQARGERRIAQLLRAAADVFAETGYEAVTTNAIAARAGVSPGTLYQFFANKASIAEALAARYADQLQTAGELTAGHGQRPVEDLLAGAIDAMVAVNLAQPGVGALLSAAGPPPMLSAAPAADGLPAVEAAGGDAQAGPGAPARRLHSVVATRLDELLAARAPNLAPADRARCVQVSIQIYKAILPAIAAASPPEQVLLVAELKQVMIRYLTPYLGS
jgi:AcrR family transcriptional regulator